MKKLIASAAIAATAFAGTAGTANAQIVANNLVGVNVSGNTVQVVDLVDANVQAAIPIGIAANVCDVNVAVLAEMIDAGDVECEAGNTQRSSQALRQIERFQLRG